MSEVNGAVEVRQKVSGVSAALCWLRAGHRWRSVRTTAADYQWGGATHRTSSACARCGLWSPRVTFTAGGGESTREEM